MHILSCIESFLPGEKGGGPVRALDNLIHQLGHSHRFDVLTRNHDYLDSQPYPGIQPNLWAEATRGQICYATDREWADRLRERLQTNPPDWLYLHGALAPMTRGILRLRRQLEPLRNIPVLIAPHGNFGPATLRHHSFRKRAWLAYAKARALYRDVRWHAASDREAEQICGLFGSDAEIRVVPMAPAVVRETGGGKQETGGGEQETGNLHTDPLTPEPRPLTPELRLVYFGRLSPEKNLPFAFELLRRFAEKHPDCTVIYDLFHLGDADPELKRLAAGLPDSIQVNFIADLPHDALQAQLRGQGTGGREQGTGDRKQGAGDRKQGAGDRKQGAGDRKQGAGSKNPPSATVSCEANLSSVARRAKGEGEARIPHPTFGYHAMLMPSRTENFSYTVLESLQAGIPVLISDQTPWRGLEAVGVGRDLPLDSVEPWLAALETLAAEPATSAAARRVAASDFARIWAEAYPPKAEGLFAGKSARKLS